jgi:hypothetical protein
MCHIIGAYLPAARGPRARVGVRPGFDSRPVSILSAAAPHDGRGAVKFHVTSIMSKLTAASRTKAIMLGLRQGLIML